MASIVPPDGPNGFFRLQYKGENGLWKKKRLPVTPSDPDVKRKLAMALAAEQMREAAMLPAGQKRLRGWAWVPGFIEGHYANVKSRQRARNAWAPVQVFLELRGISEAALVTHSHGHDYVAWRQNPVGANGEAVGVKARSKNTALTEVKLWSVILQHAVREGLALANPLWRLGIRKDPPKEKAEITREEQLKIERALANEPEWMRDAWDVAMRQGCRLGQVGTKLADIDVEGRTIRLLEQKGKRHVAPLHGDLVPLVERRRAEGAERLVNLPAVPGPIWWKFFKRIGLGHLCFHSTRVTVVTRLARAGVKEQQAKAYVGHASTTMHRVYQKLDAKDVAHLGELLG